MPALPADARRRDHLSCARCGLRMMVTTCRDQTITEYQFADWHLRCEDASAEGLLSCREFFPRMFRNRLKASLLDLRVEATSCDE